MAAKSPAKKTAATGTGIAVLAPLVDNRPSGAHFRPTNNSHTSHHSTDFVKSPREFISNEHMKSSTDTPAVYPHLCEFLHFDIQSTGQKSHCVNTLLRRSRGLTLPEQSDSLVFAPVLSCLFIAQRKVPEAFLVYHFATNLNPLDTAERQTRSAQLKS